MSDGGLGASLWQSGAAVLAGLYLLAAVILALYSGSFFVLLAIYLRTRRQPPHAPPLLDSDLPPVTLQLPIYNERHVVARLLDAMLALDYPRARLIIQVLDDSTDETAALLRVRVAQAQAAGWQIELLRRPTRAGYKAGALAYGLARVHTPFVGVFDADFVPAPDFLRRVMPHFLADPAVALVQTRWDHLNPGYNLLTRVQTLALDQHFAVEQVARSRGGLPMAMNGTGGIWRRAALDAVGGWSAATLTEDLDLSYRAFLSGWRFRYLVDVAVPGEVPPQITAYKVQQARWAKGSTQCLLRHGRALLRADLTPLQKWMGVLHLGQYAVQPVLLGVFLLTPPLLLTDWLARLPLGVLSVAGLAPPLMLALGQAALYRDWPRRLLAFPALLVLVTGMTLNNARAVLEAATGTGDPAFRRTPKFHVTRRGDRLAGSAYVLRPGWTTLGELALTLYALAGLAAALLHAPAMTGYMLLYVLAFGYVSLGGLWQFWRANGGASGPGHRARRPSAAQSPTEFETKSVK